MALITRIARLFKADVHSLPAPQVRPATNPVSDAECRFDQPGGPEYVDGLGVDTARVSAATLGGPRTAHGLHRVGCGSGIRQIATPEIVFQRDLGGELWKTKPV